MKQNSPIATVLSREVTRQEFLLILGSLILSILGVSSIIHFLTGRNVGINKYTSKNSQQGYGSSRYGV